MPTQKSAVFIVDASHDIEEKLLNEWIEQRGLAKQYESISNVVIPIAANPEDIAVDKLEQQLQADDSTDFIPVRVVWKTSLDEPHSRPRFRDLLSGNRRRPSLSQAKKILRQHPEYAQCVAGNPADLATLKQGHKERSKHAAFPESLSEYIGNQAALALDVAERRLRGSRYRLPRRVVNNMLADPSFKAGLKAIARKEKTSEEALIKRAQPIFKELIPTPSNFGQDSMEAVNRRIVTLGYDKVIDYDKEQVAKLKQLAGEKPCVLLWTHKTHVDGFAIASTLFQEDFPATHTLGGVNMAFGGLGYLARKSTAIFIRRSFSDDELYKLILRHYLGYLLTKRFPLTWAFEGTRSRVGKLMPPRYGILKYVVDAASSMGLEDLQIIPVALNYDLINDVSDYAAEQQGARKKPESLRWFLGYLRRFQSSHGKIYLNFGEPVRLGDGVSADSAIDIQKVAFQVGVEANRVSPLTLASLLTFILLGISPRGLTQAELEREIENIIQWAEQRGIPYTQSLADNNRQELRGLATFIVESKLLKRFDQGPDSVYGIDEEQHGIANYYRNTIVHHFIVKSIAELALLRVADYDTVTLQGFWNQVDLLRDSFKFEFFYAPSVEFRAQVDEELSRYDANWQTALVSGDGSNDYAAALLRKLTPHFAHSALLPFIEAYAIIAGIIARLDEGETIDQKTCIDRAFAFGKQLCIQGRVRSQASIGRLVFENGYKLLESRGLLETTVSKKERELFSRDLWAFSQRIASIRALASPTEFEY